MTATDGRRHRKVEFGDVDDPPVFIMDRYLGRLTDRQESTVRSYHLEGHTDDQIAVRRGVTRSAVTKQRHTGLTSLRRQMDRDGVGYRLIVGSNVVD